MILASCKGQGIILILLSKGKDRSLLQVRRSKQLKIIRKAHQAKASEN